MLTQEQLKDLASLNQSRDQLVLVNANVLRQQAALVIKLTPAVIIANLGRDYLVAFKADFDAAKAELSSKLPANQPPIMDFAAIPAE